MKHASRSTSRPLFPARRGLVPRGRRPQRRRDVGPRPRRQSVAHVLSSVLQKVRVRHRRRHEKREEEEAEEHEIRQRRSLATGFPLSRCFPSPAASIPADATLAPARAHAVAFFHPPRTPRSSREKPPRLRRTAEPPSPRTRPLAPPTVRDSRQQYRSYWRTSRAAAAPRLGRARRRRTPPPRPAAARASRGRRRRRRASAPPRPRWRRTSGSTTCLLKGDVSLFGCLNRDPAARAVPAVAVVRARDDVRGRAPPSPRAV